VRLKGAQCKMALPWVEFAQKEDLTVRLGNILHDYAFGPGVFRELLQNADDAKARRFALLADDSFHSGHAGARNPSPTGLLDQRLAAWQGPAVLAYNDASFSDADFEGIRRVGASVKKEDHSKIGRYGLGFNATYHLTDVVSFVSRERLCIFDPHRAHLPSDLPGLQLTLTADTRAQYSAQLEPFDAAEACVDGAGTLFRLPLRTPELAAKSAICKQAHSFQDALAILREFLASAGELLLFLQYVEELEVYVRQAPGWKCLGSAKIQMACAAASERLRKERRMLHNLVEEEVRARRTGFILPIEILGDADGGSRLAVWLVTLRAEPAQCIEAPPGHHVPNFRMAAVALPLLQGAGSETDAFGQAYCFLPLSMATGLNAHVSANFALTANRRDLWRRSDDEASSESSFRAAWNEALLEGTCPKAYCDCMELYAALALGAEPPFPTDLDLPHPISVQSMWAVWPSTGLGHFSEIPRLVSQELVARDAKVFLDADANFLSAKSALLYPDARYSKLDASLRAAISRLCLAGRRRRVVQVPEALCELLDIKGVTWLQPQSLSNMLKGLDTKVSAQEADCLVDYLLSGGSGPLSLLHGLTLCPLLSGKLGTFWPAGEQTPEYMWSEDPSMQELVNKEFVDPSSGTFALLKPRVANSRLNLRLLNSRALPSLVESVLPAAWRHKREVKLLADGSICVDDAPNPTCQPTPKLQKVPKPKVQKQNLRYESRKRSGYEDWDDYDDEEDYPENAPAQKCPPAPDFSETKPMVSVNKESELEVVVRKCVLLWKLAEDVSDKGSNPVQHLQDFPCIPVIAERVGVRLVSMQGAAGLLSVEDFASEEVKVLADFGVLLARPGPRLRTALGVHRSAALAALTKAVERSKSKPPLKQRWHLGLKDMRLDLDKALPLKRLVSSIALRGTRKDMERSLALPIFETCGPFAVPMLPGTCVITPSAEWDAWLEPHVGDFLISWTETAKTTLREFGIQRSPLPEFLARVCAPRAGLFDQELSLAFLEAVASLGAALWKKNGVQKDLAAIATACEAAPVVVFPNRRCRCCDLVDPADADLQEMLPDFAMLPPPEYCSPVVLSVLRRAGLKSLADEDVFLTAARHIEENSGSDAFAGGALLKQLAARFQSLKWTSRSFTSLSRLRIFPAVACQGAYPPKAASSTMTVALDSPCTLFQHAPIAFTQLTLLHPSFNQWPKPLLQRFGALKDPPPLPVVVANLIEVARRWKEAEAAETAETATRQGIVEKHLAALKSMSTRSHATQTGVQHSLCTIKFLVLHDGSLVSPCETFETFDALHDGRAESSDEDTDGLASKAAKSSKKARWGLPQYLRPYRRLLLGIAGPAVQSVQQLPTIYVQPAPSNPVPDFIQASLNRPELADVIFVVDPLGSPRMLYAHRLVLAAASEHFHAAFSTYAEAAEARCRVELPDWVLARPMLWMLAYLYQGYDAAKAQQVAFRLGQDEHHGPGLSFRR
ncbi:unnamed protein product, partial [Effrenium voratum]